VISDNIRQKRQTPTSQPTADTSGNIQCRLQIAKRHTQLTPHVIHRRQHTTRRHTTPGSRRRRSATASDIAVQCHIQCRSATTADIGDGLQPARRDSKEREARSPLRFKHEGGRAWSEHARTRSRRSRAYPDNRQRHRRGR
jgi:hypothetical protein